MDSAKTDQAFNCSLRLALIPGVGPATRQALLDHFGSAPAVLQASAKQLRSVAGVGQKLAAQIERAPTNEDANRLRELCDRTGIKVTLRHGSNYPTPLTDISDPPGVLFHRGGWEEFDRVSVGIVGTRHATRYGQQQTARLASGLARCGYTIVSGLARGIDTAAHQAALDAGGRTIAVLGSGLLNVYPPENVDLALQIQQAGVVMSELPPYRPPMSGTFPQRNRLISGLSLGIIVVEAASRSGALITASHAANQGRDVFAVPGPLTSRVSKGCHSLINDGAKLVTSIDDVLEELGPLAEHVEDPAGHVVHHPAELQLNDQERSVLDAIEVTPTNIDEVIAGSPLPVSRVLATLHVLETRHLIQRLPGNTVSRI